MNIRFFLFFLFLISSFIVACNKKHTHPQNRDQVVYDLNLDLLSESQQTTQDLKLSLAEKSLIEATQSKKPVSFREVTRLFVLTQSHSYDAIYATKVINRPLTSDESNAMAEDHYKYLTEVLSQSISNTDFFKLKSQYELKIKQKNGTDLLQDSDASATPYVQQQTKIQSVSGSHLNILSARMTRDGLDYRSQNYVVVFTNGHVRSGQFVQVIDQWVLMTIESTATWDAVENLGPATSLNGCMRIIDADDYIFASIFNKKINPQSVERLVESIEEKTAKKYNINRNSVGKQFCTNTSSTRTPPSEDSFFELGSTSALKLPSQRDSVGLSADVAQSNLEQESVQIQEQKTCEQDPYNCLLLPALPSLKSILKAKFFLRKQQEENLVIPYLFDPTPESIPTSQNPKRIKAILVEESVYTNLYKQKISQCDFLLSYAEKIFANKITDEFVADIFLTARVNPKKSDTFVFRTAGTNMTHFLAGTYVSHGLNLYSFQAEQKQKINTSNGTKDVLSTLHGGASLITPHDVKLIEQQCLRYKAGLPGSYR